MTVAFINASRKWGGVKTWTLDFGEALQARGHRVVAVVRPATPFEDACRRRGFQVYPLAFGPKYNPVAIARTARILKQEGAEVAVVNISKDLEIGGVAARFCGIPVLHRVGLLEDYEDRWEERLRHRLLVDHVLVPATWLAAALTDRFAWIRPGDVSAIPNSKALHRYVPSRRRSGEACIFGVTSQLSSSKGHTYLLQALEKLVRRGVPARLRVAGTGPLEKSLREETDARGLSAVVEYWGFQRDVAGFLSDLDAFAFPSLKEGFPNALLEAVCAGLPVVATALDGVVEMLGPSGLTVPPRDPDALAGALERVAIDPSLREELGRASRRRAEEQYDLEKNVGRLEALLLRLCSPGRGR